MGYYQLMMRRKPWLPHTDHVDRRWARWNDWTNKIYIPTRTLRRPAPDYVTYTWAAERLWPMVGGKWQRLLLKRKQWKTANTWSPGHYR